MFRPTAVAASRRGTDQRPTDVDWTVNWDRPHSVGGLVVVIHSPALLRYRRSRDSHSSRFHDWRTGDLKTPSQGGASSAIRTPSLSAIRTPFLSAGAGTPCLPSVYKGGRGSVHRDCGRPRASVEAFVLIYYVPYPDAPHALPRARRPRTPVFPTEVSFPSRHPYTLVPVPPTEGLLTVNPARPPSPALPPPRVPSVPPPQTRSGTEVGKGRE